MNTKKLRKDYKKDTGEHWAGGEKSCDAMPTEEYTNWLEKKLTSDNSDYANRAEELQEMCSYGASQSDIMQYLQQYFT